MTWPEALTTVGIAMAVTLMVYSICRWGEPHVRFDSTRSDIHGQSRIPRGDYSHH